MEFTDLKAQYWALKAEIDARIHRVLEHGLIASAIAGVRPAQTLP